MCGADNITFPTGQEVLGSSPRVRGRPRLTGRRRQAQRLIPACAGQTTTPSCPPQHAWAHPRVCGADHWGTLNEVDGSGLIPACAGQTWLYVQAGSVTWAHPRVCGADPQVGHSETVVNGSSPRVRGRRPDHQDDLPLVWAHPRVCGADCPGRERLDGHLGSSPRVRGRRATAGEKQHAQGLIPACAGQTRHYAPTPPASRAHPRVCGADTFRSVHGCAVVGSSPRVRGRLLR